MPPNPPPTMMASYVSSVMQDFGGSDVLCRMEALGG